MTSEPMTMMLETPPAVARHTMADRAEASAFLDFYRLCPDDIRMTYGVGHRSWPNALAFRAPGIDTLYFNRAVIFDPDRADRSSIDAIKQWYAEAGVRRYFIHCPPAEERLAHQLKDAGLSPYNRWVKLTRNAQPVPAAESEATVEKAGSNTALEFGAAITRAFEWPDDFAPWVARLVGADDWEAFIARAGEAIVAAAAIRIAGHTAYMGPAATMPEARGRGAQGVLIAARLEEALALGVKDFVTETPEDTADRSSPSYRNMRRFGFKVYYLRDNYIGYTD